MNIPELILSKAAKKVRVPEIVKETGFSQPYIHRFFNKLVEEGKLLKIGRGRVTYYTIANSEAYKNILKYNAILKNRNISESDVFDTITRQTGIFSNVSNKIQSLVNYAFTEMLNNAIEHSKSPEISISVERNNGIIKFEVMDYGIGIFNNIRKKYKLKDVYEAIQELLKGKRTTMPSGHSGEGIFFTSKAADTFIIQSSNKKILFNNIIEDIFLKESAFSKGTKVIFIISEKSKKNLKKIFDDYTDEDFKFSKTKIFIKLFNIGDEFISRSQARRVIFGLDSFKIIVLDFKNVKFIGQAFADEIFRVYKKNNQGKKIECINTNNDIEFMIKRALSNN